MNETQFIRQQLALERAHLREILRAVIQESGPVKMARPVTAYLEWAGRRLLNQLAQLNEGSPVASRTAEAVAAPPDAQAHRLLALLEAWSDPPEAPAGTPPRIAHWRKAARLSADTILEERQLYAAARTAAGLP
jgi:hypothetical protein